MSITLSTGLIGLYQMLPKARALVDRARGGFRGGHFQFSERTSEALKLLVLALMFLLAFWLLRF